MLSRFRRPSRQDERVVAIPPSAPPPDYFGLDRKQPVEEKSIYCTETLRITTSLEIRCPEGFQSLNDCLHALEVWVDENTCPIWQIHLDTWLLLCLAVHMRKDVTCTYTNLYKASFSEVLTVKHHLMVDQPVNYIEHEQRMETKYRNSKCEIRFTSKIEGTKRRGIPLHALYKYPLKDGSDPPPMEHICKNFPLHVEISPEGDHQLRFELP
ncbi:matrix [Nkolbisson virus]|uniref:Matrix protein n=1 Tax=Nkolbisson virus TaxID=380442 RepID=A0A0D3R1E8_9RHAB|nr:matrix [Nkolbisson virus]AJR28544.1 matrix [Nkolbisson virus]